MPRREHQVQQVPPRSNLATGPPLVYSCAVIGMGTSVATSELLAHRASSCVEPRLQELKEAYLARDFETFGRLTMVDSNQFHATCLDT